jgi:maltooligosyltrehalose trehalohydrolase
MFLNYNSIVLVLSYETEKVLPIRFGGGQQGLVILLHFNQTTGSATLSWPPGAWQKLLDSAEERWGGRGSRIPPVITGGEEISLELSPPSIAFFVDQENT